MQHTQHAIKFHILLEEEKTNVRMLTEKIMSQSARCVAQEVLTLKQELGPKTHGLQAVIWKINELHLISPMYSKKMIDHEQHVHYLEENLMDLQNLNRNLVF